MFQVQKHCWIATNIVMQPTKETGFLWPKILWKGSVACGCRILTQTWHETGKGSRLFWWPAVPFLLKRWSRRNRSLPQAFYPGNPRQGNFHSLQENCCVIFLWVFLMPGILPELHPWIISSSPSLRPHTCINNGDYIWVLSYFGSSFLEDKIRNLLLLLMLLFSPAKSSPSSLLLSWVFSNVCFPST